MFKKLLANFIYLNKNLYLKRNCSITLQKDYENELKYLLILDFEATCGPNITKKDQEIIEFPCLKVNMDNFKEEARFHSYVKPVLNPKLSSFCVNLTGILQDDVNGAQIFPVVFNKFIEWRYEQGLTVNNSLYVTSGDWDLAFMIPMQCSHWKLPIPPHMQKWINIKKLFADNNAVYYQTLIQIINFYKITPEGRLHSGMDDCLNLLKVVQKMGELGIKFLPTSSLEKKSLEQERL